MRVMAIDYGDTRTGVALSDPTGTLVGNSYVIMSYSLERTLKHICDAIADKQPEVIVVGYPKNMNGTIGPRAEKSALFADALREITDVPVVLRDERLTTVGAHRILSDVGKRGKKRKETVDAVAASLILENYLAELKNKTE
jgi:putative Holliday junction resolvase